MWLRICNKILYFFVKSFLEKPIKENEYVYPSYYLNFWLRRK